MKHNGANRSDVLRNIKAVLYDGDIIECGEIEAITERTNVKSIIALDFTGYCLLDIVGNIEALYGISINDSEMQNCETFSEILDLIMPLIEITN